MLFALEVHLQAAVDSYVAGVTQQQQAAERRGAVM